MFNALLIPIGFALGIAQEMVLSYWVPTVSTVMLHVVIPIYFILFYIFCYRTKTIGKDYEKKYWKYILKGSIYPVCFLFYVFIVPFVTDRWIYTHFSNCNPHLTGYEDGGDGPFTGNPLYIFIFIGVYLVFVFSISMFWLLMKRKDKSIKK